MNVVSIHFQLSHLLKYCVYVYAVPFICIYSIHVDSVPLMVFPFQSSWFSKQLVLYLLCQQVALLFFSIFRIIDHNQPGS